MAGAIPVSGWTQVGQQLPDGPLREPQPLRFLDFLRDGSVTDQRAAGEEEVRGVPTHHAAFALELDRSVWPRPNPPEPQRSRWSSTGPSGPDRTRPSPRVAC